MGLMDEGHLRRAMVERFGVERGGGMNLFQSMEHFAFFPVKHRLGYQLLCQS